MCSARPAFALVLLAATHWTQFQHFEAELVVDGLAAPTCVEQPAGETEALFVAERAGLIRVIAGGVVRPTPLLDVTADVQSGSTSGLVGFTFHPDYATNGWLYAYFSTSQPSARLVRYTVPDPSAHVADPASATDLLVVTHPSDIPIHLGGGLRFGPDGKLYLAIGDTRLEAPGEPCTSQDGAHLIGKLLRLEDDGSVPADNPFVGDPTVRDEVYALGLRQPYKMEFDPATGDLLIGDVGESSHEEVNLVPAGSGGGQNFGWRVMDGPDCTPTFLCTPPAYAPCGDPVYDPPLHSYPHSFSGGKFDCCVIGGPVYRGAEVGDLWGRYIFGDWCGGRVWALQHDGSAVTSLEEITAALDPGDGLEIHRITSFGVDSSGEVLLVDGGDPGPGELYRVVDKPLDADVNEISVATGGQQDLQLVSGAAHAGQLAILLGSFSGTSPGFVEDGVTIPLNQPDPWFTFTLLNANSGPLVNTFAVVGSGGRTESSLVIPATLGASGLGLGLDSAYVLFDAGGQVLYASNPEPLTLVP